MTVNSVVEWFKERDNFVVITHLRPDGDTLCSAAALVSGLRRFGKTAYIYPNPETTERYAKFVSEYFAPEGFEHEHVVSVDIASEGLIPRSAAHFAGKVELSIDHHGSNSFYAENTWVMAECAACGELVYKLILAMNGSVTPEEAKQLYIAISTDTGCFCYANTNADTLLAASELVRIGVPNGTLNHEIFRVKHRSRIELEGMVLEGLKFYNDGKIAVATVTQAMLRETGANEDVLDDISSIPGQIAGVFVGVTIRELRDGNSKVSLRTLPQVNACEICKAFGGGGHDMAAGCTLTENVEKTRELIVSETMAQWPEGI